MNIENSRKVFNERRDELIKKLLNLSLFKTEVGQKSVDVILSSMNVSPKKPVKWDYESGPSGEGLIPYLDPSYYDALKDYENNKKTYKEYLESMTWEQLEFFTSFILGLVTND